MKNLTTPREAVAAEIVDAQMALEQAEHAGDFMAIELAENRLYRANLAKVLTHLSISGTRYAVVGVAGAWGPECVLTLALAPGTTMEVSGREVNTDTFEFEAFEQVTPAQAYKARHNGSLHGYKPAKVTRRQVRNVTRRAVWAARVAELDKARTERTARIQHSQAAGEVCQDLKLPTYGEFVQVFVQGAAVLKAMFQNSGFPARRVAATLLARKWKAAPDYMGKRYPVRYRAAHVDAARYFMQYAGANPFAY